MTRGGKIAIEWPRNCSYWKRPEVHKFIKHNSLAFAHFHGCAVGLIHQNGKPIQKAWKVASNDNILIENLNKLRCPHSRAKGVHEPLGGSNTKRSELYTDKLVEVIHKSWEKSCKRQACAPDEGYVTAGPKPGCVNPRVSCGKSLRS